MDGEAVLAGEGQGGLFGVGKVVESVAVEVEDLVRFAEGLLDGGLAGLVGGDAVDGVAGIEEAGDKGGFGLGMIERSQAVMMGRSHIERSRQIPVRIPGQIQRRTQQLPQLKTGQAVGFIATEAAVQRQAMQIAVGNQRELRHAIGEQGLEVVDAEDGGELAEGLGQVDVPGRIFDLLAGFCFINVGLVLLVPGFEPGFELGDLGEGGLGVAGAEGDGLGQALTHRPLPGVEGSKTKVVRALGLWCQ